MMQLFRLATKATCGALLSFSTMTFGQTMLEMAPDAYLGAVTYRGGLLEKGLLTFNEPKLVQFVRVEIPSFCKGEVFEVGTVTDGVYEIAERSGRDTDTYAVHQGRGVNVKSIALSINGPASDGCSVLVFSPAINTPVPPEPVPAPPNRPTPPPPSPMPGEKFVACVGNTANYTVSANVINNGRIYPLTIIPGQTMQLITTASPNRIPPHIQISYDSDQYLSYNPVTYTLQTALQVTPDCGRAPFYQFLTDYRWQQLHLARYH